MNPAIVWILVAPLAQSVQEPSVPAPLIHLARATFDPLVSPPDLSRSALPDGGSLHLVQLTTRPLDAQRETLESLGAEILHYVPDQAFVVRMSPAARGAVTALEFVRWVGPHHPEFRLDLELLAALEAGTVEPGPYVVRLFERSPDAKQSVAEHVRAQGGAVAPWTGSGRLLRVHADAELVASLVALDAVAFVEPWTAPETDLSLARLFSGADYLEAQTGFTGQGVRGEVMDTGVDETHPDFQHTGGVLIHAGNSGTPAHGTASTGAVFGDGTGNAAARGMCPSGKIVFASFFDVVDRAAHTAELVDPLDVYQCVFQTNSWGSSHTTSYTSITAEMDDLIFDNDLLILNSQGNTGSSLGRPEAWAKNVLGIGGINHNNTLSTNDDLWTGASTGPAADGRIKPDLVHFFDNVLTTAPGGGYVITGGTSISTPITAGYFGLFFQMWHNDVFHNDPSGSTVFESRPHFSTAKAAMINTAFHWPFSGAAHNLARTKQGWGAVDVAYLYDLRDQMHFVDQTNVLSNQETAAYSIVVQPGTPELRITLVWPEPSALPGATKTLLNDLNLKLTDPDADTFYWGNVGLLTGNQSTPGGVPNDVDTVENVFIAAPEAGTWSVEVIAESLTTDIVPGTPGTNAVFSLWITGGTESCSSSAEVNYCTAGSSASGCQATLSASGVASATASSGFTLNATGVEGAKDGQFYFGANGRQAVAWGNGTSFRCVVPPTSRAGLLAGNGTGGACDGTAAQDLNALWSAKPAVNPGAGATVQAQYWYRDPQNTSNRTTSFSDALEFSVCP
jgi:hypothetical protein